MDKQGTMKSRTKYRTNQLLIGIALLLAFTACEKEEIIGEVSVEEYRDELSALVNSEIILVDGTQRGYNVGEFYTSDSVFNLIKGDYLDSLYVADSITEIPDVTFEELYYADFAITAVGRRFHGEIFIADKRALNELIGECDTLRVNTPVGTGPGEAPFEADSIFGESIRRAKIVRDDAANSIYGQSYKRNQRQVDEEVLTLDAEFTVYKDAIN